MDEEPKSSTSDSVSLVLAEDVLMHVPYPSFEEDPESPDCINRMAGNLYLGPWQLNFLTWPTYHSTKEYVNLFRDVMCGIWGGHLSDSVSQLVNFQHPNIMKDIPKIKLSFDAVNLKS